MTRKINSAINLLVLYFACSAAAAAEVEIFPREFELDGHRESAQIVVTAIGAGGVVSDLTHGASYRSGDTNIATVSSSGLVRPVANGSTRVFVGDGADQAIAIEVSGMEVPQRVSFRHQTLPVLSRGSCSSGSCHGSPHGKDGFRLSLRAFDPLLDARTLAKEEFGRRLNLIEPEKSLLLLKPTTQIAHEGGKRLEEGTLEYQILHDWIAEGGNTESQDEPLCVGIDVYPAVPRVFHFPQAEQQFSIHARFDDGSRRDVTGLAVFETSDESVATVSQSGLARGVERGDAAVIVRYLDFIESTNLTFVRDIPGFVWKVRPAANYIDELVYNKLLQLQFQPSNLSGDREFMRRVSLDVTGLLPDPDEVEAFVADVSADKRARLIDELLESEQHAAYWAQKWGDLMRLSKKQLGAGPVYKFNRWLVNAVASNQPYDEFARDVLTARGSSLVHPQANYFRAAGDTFDAMETTSQLFLGSRIQCAKCHNHPFERWTQNNYYGLAAFFNRVERRKSDRADELFVFASSAGEVTHPATKQVMQPWAPKAGTMELADGLDRREAFADWLTSKDNPFFARVEANRIWSYLMGRGIVEPFDDFRDTNPPSNPPLLDALAKDFVGSGYDRRHLLRTILNSRTYQASSQSTPLNRSDHRYFSHYQARMLTAEQLVDALGSVTGRPMKFAGVPATMKATQLPAPDLKPHDRGRIGEVEFMKVFGQPERQTICECERGDDSSLGQALEMFNGKLVNDMITNQDSHLHRWIGEGLGDDEIIRRIYHSALSRAPTEPELAVHREYIAASNDHKQALEDTLWTVLNKGEFLFQH